MPLVSADCLQENYSSSDISILQSVPTPGPIINDREVALVATDPRVIVTSTIIEADQPAVVIMDGDGVVQGFPITLTVTTFIWRNYPQQAGTNWEWYYISNADNIRNTFTPINFSGTKVITEELFNTHRGTGTEVKYIAVWWEKQGYLASEGSFTITLDKLSYTVKTSLLPVIEELPTSVLPLDNIIVPPGFGTEIFWLKMLLGDEYKYVPYVKFISDSFMLVWDANLINPAWVDTPDTAVLWFKGVTNVTVDWGDGSTPEAFVTPGFKYHTYSITKKYVIKIDGELEGFGTNNDDWDWLEENSGFTNVVSFGNLGLSQLDFAFYGWYNLINVPRVLPPTATVTSGMFGDCYAFNSPNVSLWNTSNITNMHDMFYYAEIFNQPLDSWNVSNVTDMAWMLGSTLFNQPLNSWDMSSCQNISYLFYRTEFNQPLNNWNTSNITNMGSVFASSDFNQDISAWDTSSATDMSGLFSQTPFNQNISSWNTSSVTNMTGTFYFAREFNQPLNSWDVSSVIDMQYTFQGALIFNQDLSSWDTSNVTNMYALFNGCPEFNGNITTWNTGNVTNMQSMFAGLTDYATGSPVDYNTDSFNQNIGNWDVSNVVQMYGMFHNASSFNQDLSGWCVSLIPSEPGFFADGTTAWTLPKPVWGTCP